MNQPVLPSSSNEEHMLGYGFYNKHSHEQAKANTCGLPLIIEAINQIDLGQIASCRWASNEWWIWETQGTLIALRSFPLKVSPTVETDRGTDQPYAVSKPRFRIFARFEF